MTAARSEPRVHTLVGDQCDVAATEERDGLRFRSSERVAQADKVTTRRTGRDEQRRGA